MSTNHSFSKIYKISPDTNLYKTKHTNTIIKRNIFKELVLLVLPLLKKKKKHIRLGHAGIVDISVDLSTPDFIKVLKKQNGQKQYKI